MPKGLLVSFEGQDASGKSSLVERLQGVLRLGDRNVVVIEEFSNSLLGDYLRGLLRKDRFLRSDLTAPTAMADTAALVADLYYKDEAEIRPALREGNVVLKDRHIDTIMAYQIPIIEDTYPFISRRDVSAWIRSLTSRLRLPDLTFLLKIPMDVQAARLAERGETASAEDLEMFKRIARIYDGIARRDRVRIVPFDNTMLLDAAVEKIAVYVEKMIN